MATILSRTRDGRRPIANSAPIRKAYALLVAGLLLVFSATPWAPTAAPPARADAPAAQASTTSEFGKLFDAVVEKTAKEFWDKERLAQIGWDKRAADARPSVVDAPTIEEAARRINALLGELKTSHTNLFTADNVEYYILLDVFGGADMPQQERNERFWGAGITYAGIGHFSVRIDGRDFVDAVLGGSPAERAGLKVGDEILAVDGAAYHPIRSFRGKIGHRAGVAIRRTPSGPSETLSIEVVSVAPLHAFREATRASERVIERDGRRIGHVRVWASVGEESATALTDALQRLGAVAPPFSHHKRSGDRSEPPRLDGLVIDMRGRIGGTGGNAGRYLDILDARGPLVRSRGKDSRDRARDVRGRTAVLIDHHTRSTAELFVHAYKRERQGPLIGSRTAGAVSAARAFAMPGGNLLYLAVTGLEVDGDILEGPGVAPDIEVARPIPYSNGADPVLDTAVELLVRKAGAQQREQAVPSGSN
jgi:carboxyl-terminal processing protease